MHRLLLVLFITIATNAYAGSDDPEHIVWDKKPIKILLKKGSERRIEFPGRVNVEVPGLMKASTRIITTESGDSYWTPMTEFTPQRVFVHEADGSVILLDVESVSDTSTHPLIIIYNDKEVASDSATTATKYEYYDYNQLARLAFQNLYSPKRLITPLNGVKRTSVTKKSVDIYPFENVAVYPVAQWVTSDPDPRYITALAVENRSVNRVVLNPSKFTGNYLAQSQRHKSLSPAGEIGDVTAVVLISERPFAVSSHE